MPVPVRSERPELGWPSPVLLWSIVIGVPIALVSANVWPLLLRGLGAPIGSVAEGIFLLVFLRWAAGGGPPRTTRVARSTAFRTVALAPSQWAWSLVAAIGFAVAVHATIVLLFRFMRFPARPFGKGMTSLSSLLVRCNGWLW